MELRVTWAPSAAETDGDTVFVERIIGFDALGDLDLPRGLRANLGVGGYGKGASGLGAALVLDVAEHVVNDTAGLIGIGYALKALVDRISGRRGSPPQGADAECLAALASVRAEAVTKRPEDWFHTRTVPLTTDGLSGTDVRDVWASCFLNETIGFVQVVFMSSTTTYLGTAAVATEWWFDGSQGAIRNDEDLAKRVSSWF